MSMHAAKSINVDPTCLNDHLRQCVFALGPLHRTRCAVEALDAFLAPRFVSLLLVMTALVLVGVAL
jgi:hypothetical protein